MVAHTETLIGRVAGVHDGDTLTVMTPANVQHKVRLSGIDAPELAQPYGQVSKQALSRLTLKQDIRIESSGVDKYGRLLGAVSIGAANVNATLVEQGAAWAVGYCWV